MKKPLIVTDLDGTLIKNSEMIRNQDKESFTKLHQKFTTGIATGRSIKEIEFIEKQLGFKVEVKIAFNGAIMKVKDKKIFDYPISKKDIKEVILFLKDKEILFDALDGESRMGTYETDNHKKLWNMHLYEPKELLDTILGKIIYKINIRPTVDKMSKVFEELSDKFPHLSICKSGKTRIELTAANTSKGNAIQYLQTSEIYGPIIAAGDSQNDISLFKKSDIAFCIENAEKKVKSHADFTVQDFSKLKKIASFY